MRYIFSFLAAFCSLTLFAQQTSDDDFKVGLVLSGGGAKGLAHIGVLKEIEKAGVQIDYIGGTSMGSIVGSLYAAGYTADQLDSIFRTADFIQLIQDQLPRNVKSFYQKEGANRYVLSLPFDHFKVSFPSGLSKGQNIYNLLSQLFYPVRHVHDFSKLPIPFFCVGTNIETGEAVVLNKGSLAKSVLASSAIPSLFTPVEIDGQLLSDGGIVNNYPVEEMRKRGVDYIIGVDVQDSLMTREQLKSALDILNQMSNFERIKAVKYKKTLTDLYIKPDITSFTILSFDKGEAIIESGVTAAKQYESTFDSIAELQDKTQIRPHLQVQDSITIAQIQLRGNYNYPRSFIRGRLHIPIDEEISYKQFNQGLDNLVATENFERIDYSLFPQDDGSNKLLLQLKENNRKTSLRLSLHYDELYKSAALVNVTRKQLLFDNDIISLDFIVGDNFRYKFNYFIDKGNYWSVGLKSSLNQFEKDVSFDFIADQIPGENFNVNKIQLHYMDLTNQFYVETFFANAVRFGAGFEHKYTKLETETILVPSMSGDQQNVPFTILEEGSRFGPYGYLEYDSYDNHHFPNHGFYFRGDLHFYLFGIGPALDFERFSVIKGKIGYAFTPFKNFAVRLQSETGTHIGHPPTKSLNFYLGGYGNDFVNNIQSFLGYDFLAESGNSYIKGLIQLDYQPIPRHHILATYNIANIGDDLYEGGEVFSLPDYTGMAIGYGIESLVGPLEIHYSYSPERGSGLFFVSLGFWF